MKTIFLFSMFFLTVFGCSIYSSPGDIFINKSEFDGTIQVSMEPAFVCLPGASTCEIKFDLMHNSKMPADEVIMRVLVQGGAGFSSVRFNIDGEIIELSSIDGASSIDSKPGLAGSYHIWASARYKIDKKFLQKLLTGKSVVVRIDHRSTYVEGVFTYERFGATAKPAFQKFYDKVFGP